MLARRANRAGGLTYRVGSTKSGTVKTVLPRRHNGGPPLEAEDPDAGWRHYCWRRGHKAAWKTPPREIALRRLARAEALGITYREYTLEILERGRYL